MAGISGCDLIGQTLATWLLTTDDSDARNRLFARLSPLDPVAYAEGLSVTSPRTTVTWEGNVYIARPDQLPFTTGAELDPLRWRMILNNGTGPGGWQPVVAELQSQVDELEQQVSDLGQDIATAPGTLADLANGPELVVTGETFPAVPSLVNGQGGVDALNTSLRALADRDARLSAEQVAAAEALAADSGAGLVGFKRTNQSLAIPDAGSLSGIINNTPVYLTEYQAAADKSYGPTPADWNWVPAIEAALADIYENHRGCTLVFPPIPMTFPGADGIAFDLSRLSVDFNGCQIYAPNLSAGNAAVTVTRSAPEANGSQFQLGRFSLRNLSIRGSGLPADGTDKSTYAVGLRWVSSYSGTSVRFSTYNLTISDIGIAEQFLDRSYLVHHYKTSLSNSGVCIDMPSGRVDYGENVSYFGGVFSGGKFTDVTNTLSDFFFFGVSFDYPKHPNATYLFRHDGVANFYGCHLEIGNEFNQLLGLDHVFHLGSPASVVLWDGGWISTTLQYVGIDYFVAQVDNSNFEMRSAYVAGIIPSIAMSNRPAFYRQRDMKLYRPNPGISYKGSANLYDTIVAAGGSTLASCYWYDGTGAQRLTTSLVAGNIEVALTTISDAVGRGFRLLIPIPRGAVGMDVEFASLARAATAGTSVLTVEASFAMLDKSKAVSSPSLLVRRTPIFTMSAQNLANGPISRSLANTPRAQSTGMNVPDYAEYLVLDLNFYGSSEPQLATPAKITLSGLKIHAY